MRSISAVLACFAAVTAAAPASLYDIDGVVDIEGRNMSLGELRGRVTLVINVATY